ncbi:MAG: response regulator [Actinobacteria bacterium]|nr:response regulator [Actinomycetota bacterium]
MTLDLAHPAISVDMLGRLLDQVTSAILAVDATGTVIIVNAEAKAILRSPVSLVGTELAQAGDGRSDEFRALADALLGCLASPRVLRRQTAVIGPSGDARVLGYTIAPLMRDEVPDGAVVIFTDLTAVREKERSRLENERFAQVGRVASWMAHEVKNPLATIQMYAQLASKSIDPAHQDIIQVIREQVVLAQSRISDMLRSLTLQSEEPRKLAVTDLASVLRTYLEKDARGLPHVTFSADVASGTHHVPLNASDALSIVSNLITNAAEALDEPGLVRVELASRNGRTVFLIRDGGPGFPDEDLQRLLQPFFTTKKRGTGLGLWVVRRIVQGAGGTLELSNTDEGGACVTVELPRLAVSDLEGKNALVVEDDATIRRLLCRQLHELGASTQEAAGGLEALDLLGRERFDILITDINMPRGGGHALLRQLPQDMPVLMISGLIEADAVQALTNRRGIAFLMKPFAAEEFGLALSYLLWETSFMDERDR